MHSDLTFLKILVGKHMYLYFILNVLGSDELVDNRLHRPQSDFRKDKTRVDHLPPPPPRRSGHFVFMSFER